LIEPDVKKYFFINQGMTSIDGVDDCQEMKDTKVAFDVLQFPDAQQVQLFQATAAVAIFGNSKWKQKPREEQAEFDGTDEIERVATLLGLDQNELLKGLTKPKIKVGNDFVNKGQNISQVTNSVGALSKAIYGRLFNWLVEMVNMTLDVKEVKRVYFIGVLDIAGFEAFEYNGFEQLCINFTNERLQQFFNNFMFVLEQEEYTKEGIVWEMMSFGADLEATIGLIGAKMGIFQMLEEECIVPKATDMTYKDKLIAKHLGKCFMYGAYLDKRFLGQGRFGFEVQRFLSQSLHNIYHFEAQEK
jgi:myosin heavy subunit